MKRNAIAILIIAALFLSAPAFCQKLRTVTIGMTSKTIATLPFEMSIRKGHFRQEGLNSQL
jgi:hypothetical protein